MEKVIDPGHRERKRDLWEPLIQGPANAHIHEDLELPLQLQRSLLCFPLRMPSSTPNTVRSLFLSLPSLSFSPAPFLRICTPPNPCSFLPLNWRTCVLFIHLLLTSFFLYPLLFFSHLYSVLSPSLSVSPTQSLTLSVSLSVSRIVSPFGFGLFAV